MDTSMLGDTFSLSGFDQKVREWHAEIDIHLKEILDSGRSISELEIWSAQDAGYLGCLDAKAVVSPSTGEILGVYVLNVAGQDANDAVVRYFIGCMEKSIAGEYDAFRKAVK